jgi:hypothetical protein
MIRMAAYYSGSAFPGAYFAKCEPSRQEFAERELRTDLTQLPFSAIRPVGGRRVSRNGVSPISNSTFVNPSQRASRLATAFDGATAARIPTISPRDLPTSTN